MRYFMIVPLLFLMACETDLSVECDGHCRITENSKITGGN